MSRSAIWRRALLLGIIAVLLAAFAASAAAELPGKVQIDSADPFKVIPVSRGQKEPTWAEGEILVRLKTYMSAADADAQAAAEDFRSLNAVLGAEVVEAIPVSAAADVYKLKIPATMSVAEAVIRYESSPFVRYAEPNYLWYPDATYPNDRFFTYEWLYNMHNTGNQAATERWFHAPLPGADINAPEAWDVRTDASDVIVCVIDQGIQSYHPDLAPNMWVNEAELHGEPGVDDDGNGFVDDVYGYDFYYDDGTIYHDDPNDDYHGTHCAGIIGARGNDAVAGGFHGGVAGVAWNVQIMSCKFLGPGGGQSDNAIKALNYAKKMGATITSNSWGGGGYSKSLEEAIANSGMLFIAAAGNEGVDNDIMPHYPSSYDLPNVIAVAATEWNDKVANFSNWGANSVDIGAPGHMILSCYPDGTESVWAWMGGTSMATPHVAGAAALLIAEYPDLPQYPGAPGWMPGQETIKDILLKSGDPLPDLMGTTTTGRRLNVANALNRVYPPGIAYAGADSTFGKPRKVNFEARLENPGSVAQCWWQFGDQKVYGLVASCTFEREGSLVAWFYAQGIDGSISKAPVQVTAANPGTIVYVDDTGAFSIGLPVSILWMLPALDAQIPFVRVDSRYPLGLSTTAVENPIFWDTGFTRFEVVSPWDQEFLASFMDNGGRVFFAAPDYLGDMGLDWFGTDYLHIDGAYGLNVEIDIYKGVEGDPISDGIGLEWMVKTRRDDLIAPDLLSQTILTGAWDFTEPGGEPDIMDLPGALGLRHANDTYRIVYLSCPWSSLMYEHDPNNPSTNSTPYLLTKIYEYLMDDELMLPPVIDKAEASLYFAKPGQVISFSGDAHDPNPLIGRMLSYEWDFDDGTTTDKPNAMHAYAETGVYRPTLWVTNLEGDTVGAELQVIVLDTETIVFVDDDEGEPDTEGYWDWLLTELRKEHVIVEPSDVIAAGGAKAGLEQFRVIWNCGQFGSLDDAEQDAVANYLDQGGRLFLSGPEVMWVLDPEKSEFARNYLHVIGKKDDVGTTKLWGVPGDPITDGLEIALAFGEFVDGTDSLDLGPGARPVFLNDAGKPCALRCDDEHRLMFFAFMFEAIPLESPREPEAGSRNGEPPPPTLPEILLGAIADWLGVEPEVEVLAPLANDTWHGVNQVQWKATHAEDAPLTVTLQYSFDGGAAWTTFATGLPNGEPPEGKEYTGTYNWDVSKAPRSGPCKVRVVATDKYGTSSEAESGQFLLINAGVNSFVAGPNPASDSMNFWVNASGGATLYIYDIAGRQVFSHEFEDGQNFHVWNLVDKAGKPLANGLYLCYMVTADGVKTDIMRLVISR